MKKTFIFHPFSDGKLPEVNSVVLLNYIPKQMTKGVRLTAPARYIGKRDDGPIFTELGSLRSIDGDFLSFAYIDPVLPFGRAERLRLRYWHDLTGWQRMAFDLAALTFVILSFKSASVVLYILSVFVYIVYNKLKSYE